jgi:hypothetical protein
MKALLLAGALALASLPPALAQTGGVPATTTRATDGAGVTLNERWQTVRDPATGISVQFPSTLMAPVTPVPEGLHRAFAGPDGARLAVMVKPSPVGGDLAALERQVRAAYGPDTRVTYEARAANWFVIAGLRGDQEFLERYHLTRDGAVMSALVATYPGELGFMYDAYVARMSRTFVAALRLPGAVPQAATPAQPRPQQANPQRQQASPQRQQAQPRPQPGSAQPPRPQQQRSQQPTPGAPLSLTPPPRP